MATRALLAIVLIAALGVPASSAAAERQPKLSVSRLSSPPELAKAGDGIQVEGTVANRGDRRARPRVSLSLRTEANAKPGEALATERIRRVRAADKRAFTQTAEVPEVEPGRYLVAACVKRRGKTGRERCRASATRIEIAATEPPSTPESPVFTPGAQTLGDPLLPQIGNGGYEAEHYDLGLDYDRATNEFVSARTKMTAIATQDLSELSLDFQDLPVDRVTIDGSEAQFRQTAALPAISDDPIVTQPQKLVVTPAAGIASGRRFTVEIVYHGEPQVFTDPDTSIEGWIPSCYGISQTCDSNFVVGEPMGSQAWFPSNNFPSDKATFETAITVRGDDQAFGVGELVGEPVANGDGTTTWRWSEDDPTATYLATASNGDFDYTETTATESATGRTLPVYNAIDPSATPLQLTNYDALVGRNSDLLDFYEPRFGSYPFDSYGALYDNTTGIGYALEVQGKSHFASLPDGGTDPAGGSASTYNHELAHSWFGNAVTLRNWNDIWFNEGWAQFAEWEYGYEFAGDPTTPTQQFQQLYDDPDFEWSLAPAVLDGDPANLFNGDATYARGGMTVQGYRDILDDDDAFFEFARQIQADHAYGNISTREFIAAAVAFSGFEGADRSLLEAYFEQWLYGTRRPTIVPADFQP